MNHFLFSTLSLSVGISIFFFFYNILNNYYDIDSNYLPCVCVCVNINKICVGWRKKNTYIAKIESYDRTHAQERESCFFFIRFVSSLRFNEWMCVKREREFVLLIVVLESYVSKTTPIRFLVKRQIYGSSVRLYMILLFNIKPTVAFLTLSFTRKFICDVAY